MSRTTVPLPAATSPSITAGCRASKPCRWRSCSGSTWTRTIPATYWNRRVSRRQRRSSPTPSGASPRRCGKGLLRKRGKKEEGRRKKEEGRRKKEEGRRKKEEGRRKKEEGRRSAASGLTFLLTS